jgi:putative membrane protein insertion efficiency factor
LTDAAKRRRVLGLGAAMALVLSWDLSRSPSTQWSTAVLLQAIDAYQATGSLILGRAGVRCRFEPTCSRYAEQVIEQQGALIGVSRSLTRLARCGPWTSDGTSDPP